MHNVSNNIIILISAIICYILLNKFYTYKSSENNEHNNKYIKIKSLMYAFIFMIIFYIKEIIGTTGSILIGALGIYLVNNILCKYFEN